LLHLIYDELGRTARRKIVTWKYHHSVPGLGKEEREGMIIQVTPAAAFGVYSDTGSPSGT